MAWVLGIIYAMPYAPRRRVFFVFAMDVMFVLFFSWGFIGFFFCFGDSSWFFYGAFDSCAVWVCKITWGPV